jgi:hypothetical protein
MVHSRASSGVSLPDAAAVIGVDDRSSSLLLIRITSVSKRDCCTHSSEREARMERYLFLATMSVVGGARSGRLWNSKGRVALSIKLEYAPHIAERPLMTTCLIVSVRLIWSTHLVSRSSSLIRTSFIPLKRSSTSCLNKNSGMSITATLPLMDEIFRPSVRNPSRSVSRILSLYGSILRSWAWCLVAVGGA